ncbi:MAG TPA: LON peptidase substrate-binding domain-containing protein, partial [Tepidisphaeraceae bacterium]|nr:LON peptidase substrate-binding domain-containing protein [Tepidisphaeraceae bacterium]
MSYSRSIVRLFPLPNVVLFPQAILPLHIFEERYKEMVSEALSDDGQIATALLKRGWVHEYYGKPAIESVVCVGQVVNYERLPGGQFNLLLQGSYRGIIESEISGKRYRRAHIRRLSETKVAEIDLSSERWRLQELFLQAELGPIGKHYSDLVASELKTADVADL